MRKLVTVEESQASFAIVFEGKVREMRFVVFSDPLARHPKKLDFVRCLSHLENTILAHVPVAALARGMHQAPGPFPCS